MRPRQASQGTRGVNCSHSPSVIAYRCLILPPILACLPLLLLALLVGCGTLAFDYLPKDAPRGYVEFRPFGTLFSGGSAVFWELIDGERRPVIKPGTFTWRFQGSPDPVRVATSPGSHTYVTGVMPAQGGYGGATETVTVQVREGHVTPIWIRCKILKFTGGGSEFTMSVEGGDPVPLTK